ncbi:g3496 [Coccomyxa viridis]|uniref:G3496 protein n=1 Tax=Coccomyxa viridis TaxID=1274662 RepID=A0ABP1FV27_9CHLO
MVRNNSSAEAKNSLLQLSNWGQVSNNDRDGIDTGADSAGSDESSHAAAQSIITQVNSRSDKPAVASEYSKDDATEQSASWKDRLRAFFCCFAPDANEQYYRSSKAEATVIRPPQPPTPPAYRGEPVIGPLQEQDRGKKTLVLDLDETLVHSSFKPIPNPDYIIPVEIEGKIVDVYVLKRPWLDHFMAAIAGQFEIVVFTASLSKYADPLLDLMDKANVVRWRLFREACCPYEGNYVKDLLCLGRPLQDSIIVDNSPHSYVFQPDNALPIGTFIDDPSDRELLDILPVLQKVEKVADVRAHLGTLVSEMASSMLQRHSLYGAQ